MYKYTWRFFKNLKTKKEINAFCEKLAQKLINEGLKQK